MTIEINTDDGPVTIYGVVISPSLTARVTALPYLCVGDNFTTMCGNLRIKHGHGEIYYEGSIEKAEAKADKMKPKWDKMIAHIEKYGRHPTDRPTQVRKAIAENMDMVDYCRDRRWGVEYNLAYECAESNIVKLKKELRPIIREEIKGHENTMDMCGDLECNPQCESTYLEAERKITELEKELESM